MVSKTEHTTIVSQEGLKHAIVQGVSEAERRISGVKSARVLEIRVDVDDGVISDWIIDIEFIR